MKKKFYGVYAENGWGVYSDYGKLVKDRTYMRSEHIRSFDDKEDAEDFALDSFILLHGTASVLEAIPDMDMMKLNYFYFYRKGETQTWS